jgi:hypothetical protein
MNRLYRPQFVETEVVTTRRRFTHYGQWRG